MGSKIVCILYAIFFVKYVRGEGPGHDNTTEGYISMIAAWPPIWKTTYTYRSLGFDDSFSAFKFDLNTISPDFVYTGNLTTSPWKHINRDTSYLYLECHQYNNWKLGEEITDGRLSNYNLLLSFHYVNCRVDHLSYYTFRGLKRLKVIYLRNNGLKSISIRAFEGCSDLLWFNFGVNDIIKYISQEHFCYNSKLEYLQIKETVINSIHTTNNTKCVNLSINSMIIEYSNFVEIKPYTFKPFAINGVLTIKNCSIKSVTKTFFEGLERALDLDLERNEISYLEENVFDHMKTNLQKISLSKNTLTNITIPKVFDSLNISYLLLDNNFIQRVYGQFSQIHKLQYLDLSCNKIKSIQKLFQNMFNLIYLNLSTNLIGEIRKDDFFNMSKIETFDISNNKKTKLPDDVFLDFEMIKEVRLQNNNLEVIPEEFCVKCKHLTVLDISQNRLNVKKMMISSHSLTFVDVSNNAFENIPAMFDTNRINICTELEILKASKNNIKHFSPDRFLSLVTLEIGYNKIEFLPHFEGMSKLKAIYMRGNLLQNVQGNMLCGRDSVLTYADFGENEISKIETDAFKNCLKLETLLLDNNMLKSFYNIPTSLKILHLSKNPISCGCELKSFVDEITLNKGLHTDFITCLLHGTNIDIKKANIQVCVVNHTKQLIIDIAVPTGSVILVAIIFTFVIFRYRYEIEVIAFYKWNIRLGCCFGKKRQKRSFGYDAFICLAEEDLNFVKNTLIPLLEPQFRLCIYYRDFPVGADIAEAILDVIDNSAVIMVLLSEAFIRSRWGNFEFRHAHHNSMQNEDQKLLVIILEESVLDMELDLTLKSILFSKAYLKRNDRLFNQKLLHAMPDKDVEHDEIDVRSSSSSSTTGNDSLNEQERLIF